MAGPPVSKKDDEALSGWNERELDVIGAADEILVTPDRRDGPPGPPVPIWVVRVVAVLYVRSYRGTSGGWYRRASLNGTGRLRAGGEEFRIRFSAVAAPELRAQIDRAYRTKYGRHGGSHVPPMTSDSAAATTLQLEPAG